MLITKDMTVIVIKNPFNPRYLFINFLIFSNLEHASRYFLTVALFSSTFIFDSLVKESKNLAAFSLNKALYLEL